MADKLINEPGHAEAPKRRWVDRGDGTYAPEVATVGGGGGDGSIQDGSNPSVEATVFDYTNANPLATQLVDSNGDPIAVGGGTQYAEDTASAAGEQITMAGVVRKDAAASLVGTDGDRTELQVDATGQLRVVLPAGGGGLTDAELRASPVPVTGGGGGTEYTEGDTDASITGSAILWEDAADTLRPVSAAKPLPVDLQDASVAVTDGGGSLTVDGTVSVTEPVSVDDNGGSLTVDGSVDIGALPNEGQQTMANSISVAIASNQSSVPVADGGGSLTVDGSVSLAAAIPAGTNNIGDVDVLSVPAPLSTTGGGTEATAHRVTIANDSTGVLSVDDNGGSLTVDGSVSLAAAVPAGTNNIGDVDIASFPAAALEVVGDVAADAAVPANPVTVGGRSNDAVPTEVSADGESVYLWLLRNGATMTALAPHLGMIGDPYTLTSKTVQQTTAQTGTDVLTPTAGKRLVITSCQIQAGGTTAATVQLWFGANADTSYTRGTDLAIFDGEFAPSATLKPGWSERGPWIASAADHEVHLTTSAGITITITLWYYEV